MSSSTPWHRRPSAAGPSPSEARPDVSRAPGAQGERRADRLLLKSTLERLGFVNPAEERWHHTFKPEARPDTYSGFPVSRGPLTGHHRALSEATW